jgi:hypothetical protein
MSYLTIMSKPSSLLEEYRSCFLPSWVMQVERSMSNTAMDW